MVGISGVAVCLCPCFCLHFWQVCCFAAEVEPDAHAPLPVSAATVAAAGRVFVRPAEAAVAASVVVAVLSVGVVAAWPHRRSAAGFSAAVVAAADTAFAGPSDIPDPVFAAAAESVPGASVPVAGSRCSPDAKWEDGPDRGSDSHWDSRLGWRRYLDWRSRLDSRWRSPADCCLPGRSRLDCCLPARS